MQRLAARNGANPCKALELPRATTYDSLAFLREVGHLGLRQDSQSRFAKMALI